MWKRTIAGRELHFRLAGINNQNFLMRDDETGTWWQQVSGKALSGPLKGQVLEGVSSDELTFALWRQEVSGGQVLAPVAAYEAKYESAWEAEVAKLPTPISFPGRGLASRDVVMGIVRNGVSRAYPVEALKPETPVQDHVGGTPLLLVVGPDGKSIRAFVSQVNGTDTEFFRKSEGAWTLVDSASGSEWNFQGCATSGPAAGKCLVPVQLLKDYWFDWRNYHPDTGIYRH